ncbi:GGDEF domain-containing protein [Butyrivibrio sp. AE3006]|uniref:GGDEF domain-containing protein n=1 Tax=Butyrivibrio sp. AE3006 TaxID=1280673 RepID=UPI00040E6102|nr:GGDEF domain-containing protein [Butyrivibrio sp. AE3006]
MTEVFYYIQANLACFLILGLILYKINHGIDRQTSTVILRRLIIVLMTYFFSDSIWIFLDSGVVNIPHPVMIVVSIIPFVLIVCSSYFWFVYCEILQQDKLILTRKGAFISSIPILITVILIISASFTGIVFYFDENNHIKNGPLYGILVLVPLGYMAYASIKGFYRAFTQGRYMDHIVYLTIGVFPFIPIITGVLQVIFIYIPFMCYGATFSIMLIYLATLENLISMDSLTQVNNRNQMHKYLIRKMKNPSPNLSLYLMIIDIDHFKEINDTYGHIEGDKALVRVANAMKDACQAHRNRFFVSRFGGDEFIVIAETEYKGEVNWLSEKIRSNVKLYNDKAEVPYNLSVCVGIAEYDYANPVPIPSLIARADSDLYHMKHART